MRLVGPEGEMMGVMSSRDAQQKAYDAGLDLVEISPNSEPPVCKILDYGKFKYQNQKKQAEAKKKQKIITVKEIKVRPYIEENDYQVKKRKIEGFLGDGDKVKISMRLRGREMAHKDVGMKIFERLKTELEELAKFDEQPRFEGQQIIMIISPSATTANK